ncbi:MAG: UDP-N-acetylmuramate dehydrogenase [Bacteroidaceae bacterium]|nr:UDP-N-acetylmuramate dehydrogenase [Bacteroidaceae bacterium]
MTITDHASLLPHNTFGIEATARQLVEYDTVEELQAFIRERSQRHDETPLLHIGGGSNLLFLCDFPGTVLHSRIQDILLMTETEAQILVRVGAGVKWDDFVQYAVDHQWYGLENLSLIPGEVGASAVQNIGAYGAEAKDFILAVEAVDLQTGELRTFQLRECRYGYRDSVFKHELRGRYAVTHVMFSFIRQFQPLLGYGGILRALEEKGIDKEQVTPAQLRQTIIEIRRSKLPEPSELGNAGSFFTNPIVPQEVYERIAVSHPEMPHYEADEGQVKIPAGWLIEQSGWKGRTVGRAGVYEKQALVLVNRGGATGAEIAGLCRAIQTDVQKQFGITITPEVNFIG